jgi:hypothetical protein
MIKHWMGNRLNGMLFVFLGIAILGGVFINNNRKGKEGFSNNYLGPYLSAAADYRLGQLFMIDTAEVNRFRNLDDIQKELAFTFKEKGTYYYNHNPVGYIYFIQLGKFIFGRFSGDAQSVVWLQLLAHLICSSLIWVRLKSDAARVSFGLLYIVNPLILYFVTFNFYYFWQVIPCLGVLLLWMDKKVSWIAIAIVLIMPFMLATRPTLFFVALLFFALLGYYSRWYWGIAASIGCILVFSFIYAPNKKNPWHTAYIGLGAYPNKLHIPLSDESGYQLYEHVTGKKLNVSVGGNYYDNAVIDEYAAITKEATLGYIKRHPFAVVRNATLNFLQSYALGYFVNKPFIVYVLMALAGFCLLAFSAYKKYFIPLICIATYAIAFIPYFPPIPAYHFGAYLPFFLLLSLFAAEAIRSSSFGKKYLNG